MIRTLWFYCSFLTVTAILATVMLMLTPVDRSGTFRRSISIFWGQCAVTLAGIDLQADMTAVPQNGPAVFVFNHQSQFDIPIAMLLLAKQYPAFVAKKSLFSIPLLGWCFRVGGHIPIDRRNSRQAMRSLDNAAKIARAGRSIIIYPEGTRQKDTSALGEFRIGGILLALKTGLPVVPVVLEGTGDILPKGNITLRPRQVVTARALPPLDTALYTLRDRDRFRDDLHTAMSQTYQEMRTCRTRRTS